MLLSGKPYRFLGLIEARVRLVCPAGGATLQSPGHEPVGGGDSLMPACHGAQHLSLTVGLLGILVSFTIGIALGGLAGYLSGWVKFAGGAAPVGNPRSSREPAVARRRSTVFLCISVILGCSTGGG